MVGASNQTGKPALRQICLRTIFLCIRDWKSAGSGQPVVLRALGTESYMALEEREDLQFPSLSYKAHSQKEDIWILEHVLIRG